MPMVSLELISGAARDMVVVSRVCPGSPGVFTGRVSILSEDVRRARADGNRDAEQPRGAHRSPRVREAGDTRSVS